MVKLVVLVCLFSVAMAASYRRYDRRTDYDLGYQRGDLYPRPGYDNAWRSDIYPYDRRSSYDRFPTFDSFDRFDRFDTVRRSRRY